MGLKGTSAPSPERRATILRDLRDKLLAHGEFRDDFWVLVSGDEYLHVIDYLRSHPELQFDSFVDLCGVDRLPKSPRFEVVVHLFSQSRQHRIRIRCEVPDRNLSVPSLASRWKGADWQEREAYDMYGIRFSGHPNLARILSPEDAREFPQRKDYPLRGEREENDF